jgi:acyl carrier protein
MEGRLNSVFAEGLGLTSKDVSDETSPENTPEWDSLAAMGLVALLEETFEVQLSTEEIMSMRSVGLVREVLRTKGVGDV